MDASGQANRSPARAPAAPGASIHRPLPLPALQTRPETSLYPKGGHVARQSVSTAALRLWPTGAAAPRPGSPTGDKPAVCPEPWFPRANEGGREQRPDARDIARAGLCAAGCRDWASLRPILDWIAVPLSNVKRTAARLPSRRFGVAAPTRPGVGAGPRRGTVATTPAHCVACRREGAALPRHQSKPGLCRSDPDRSWVCPHPGLAVPGGLAPSTASSALRRTPECAALHRARIARGSPLLATVFRTPAPGRRTEAASCLQLLDGR